MGVRGKIFQVKVTLLGDSGAGKTAIALRFTADSFNNGNKSTLGGVFVFVSGIEPLPPPPTVVGISRSVYIDITHRNRCHHHMATLFLNNAFFCQMLQRKRLKKKKCHRVTDLYMYISTLVRTTLLLFSAD